MGALRVTSESVQGLAALHGDVAAHLSHLSDAGSDPDVAGSHGTIADPVNRSLDTALTARRGTVQSARASSETVRRMLERSAELYASGDAESAQLLERAAGELERAEHAPPKQTAEPDGAADGGGADTAGQLAGQVAQGLGAAAQLGAGLMAGFAALPGQVIQGLQGAMQGTAAATPSVEPEPMTGTREPEPDDDDPDDDSHDEEPPRSAESDPEQVNTGRAPIEPAPETPPRTPPAQTRPA